MHKDRVAFYKMGDAVLNNAAIIENKIGGSALISISTIINAIDKLYEIVSNSDLSTNSLIKKLTNFYIQVGSKDIELQIQEGAGKAAERGIEQIVKQIMKN